MGFSSFLQRSLATVAAVSGCLFASSAMAGVVLNVANGKLTGASGITVGALSGTYSVQFVDGTCAAVFGECLASAFAFQTVGDASAAASALLTSVFVGIYDQTPSLTVGCNDPGYCVAVTPYGVFTDTDQGVTRFVFAGASNGDATLSDGVFINSSGVLTSNDLFNPGPGTDPNTWARWTRDPAAPEPSIPVPGTLPLVGLAAAALMWTQRRRRTAAQIQ